MAILVVEFQARGYKIRYWLQKAENEQVQIKITHLLKGNNGKIWKLGLSDVNLIVF
jgi:hypothetical protein